MQSSHLSRDVGSHSLNGHPAHRIILPTGSSQPTVLPLQPLVSPFVLLTPKDTIKGAGGDVQLSQGTRCHHAVGRRGGTAVGQEDAEESMGLVMLSLQKHITLGLPSWDRDLS